MAISQKNKIKVRFKKGFSTLFIVIIIGSVALALALVLSTSSVWSIRNGTNSYSSAKAKALINACAEIALETIRNNTSYTGTATQTLDGSSCAYTVSNGGGNIRNISVSGTVNGAIRKLSITTNAFNPIVVSSWQETI